MNSLSMILGFSITIGLPEIIIFLLAAILLGFSIHFYWAGRRSVPGLSEPMPAGENGIAQDDQWRLQFYEQIEKHEKTQERLEKEIKRMTDAEKMLMKELEETREEVGRLEVKAEKGPVSENSTKNISDLVMAQQNLHEALTREMTERLEKAYEEFNFLQDRIQKLQTMVIDPHKRNFELEEIEQSYFRITKEYDELKVKHLQQIEENQQLTRLLADSDEKLRDATFSKQQLTRKVNFLEELVNDLQQVSGHHKKLEGQLKRISEIESLLSRQSSIEKR